MEALTSSQPFYYATSEKTKFQKKPLKAVLACQKAKSQNVQTELIARRGTRGETGSKRTKTSSFTTIIWTFPCLSIDYQESAKTPANYVWE